MLKDKKLYAILGLSFISFFSTLWITGADLMESRNFITAREIVHSNNWLVTTLNGEYRFEKPPLPTWLTAIVMKLFNNFSDEWLLRIPVALVSVLLIYFIYKFILEFIKDNNLAFLASFVATTTFMIVKVGTENAWDAYPYIFMFGSITYLIKLFNNNKIKYLILSSILLSASLLSKGPVALYGMFLPFTISYIFVYGKANFLKNKKNFFIYLILGILIAGIWPIAMLIENKELFLSVMNKEKDTWSNRHVKGIFFYLSYFMFMGSWAIFSLSIFLKKWKFKDDNNNKLFKFGVIWAILTFILLSLIKMKKERYGLPIYIVSTIPIGIIINYYLNLSWNFFKKFDRILFLIQAIFLSIICLGSIFLIIFKGILISNIHLSVFLLSIIPFGIILYCIIKSYFTDKDTFKKVTIYSTGILLVVVNCSLTWIVEKNIRSSNKSEFKNLDVLQKKQLDLNIYSQNFNIQDVWNIGKNIHKSENLDIKDNKFYILSNSPNNDLNNKFHILSSETYYQFKDSDKTVFLYKVKQKKPVE